MTYSAGWRYRNSVYLISDAALTGVPPMKAHSSFGESHEIGGVNRVEEATLKLAQIGEDAAVNYSGNVQLAAEIITSLRERYDRQESSEAMFAAVARSYGPFAADRAVAILLARAAVNQEPRITCWNTISLQVTDASEYVELGSLPDSSLTRQSARTLLSKAIQAGSDEAILLPQITSVVQSSGVHRNLIEYGVGGTIWGLQVCAGQVHWQPSTAYIVGDRRSGKPHLILAFMHQDILVVQSMYSKSNKFFAFPFGGRINEDQVAKAIEDLSLPIDWNRWRCLVYLPTAHRTVVLMSRESMEMPSRFVTFEKVTGKGIGINLRDKEIARVFDHVTRQGKVGAFLYRE
jgi:hypothetical protein